jgi:DNA-binding NtrC family response regulator
VKKTPFEAKLYTQLLQNFTYTFEVANSLEELQKMIKVGAYKVILFDKEYTGLKAKNLSIFIKKSK